jgi:enoyl-CoA hydratase/carnithine racemase
MPDFRYPQTETVSDAVLHERRGAGLWLTLNRPDKLNGLSPEILAGLLRGLDEAETDPEVRALVIAAEGRAFCAGADLAYIQKLHAEDGSALSLLHEVSALFERLERSPVPIIGVVRGLAGGGGLELLLCCDIVLLGEAARLGDSHANYGLLPGGGATARLPRAIGAQRAKQLMFSGDFLGAAGAFALGLGNEVVEDPETRAADLVESFARKSPLGLARMKQLVGDALEAPVPVGVRAELAMVALHETSFDQQEGIAAFNEKRRPRFEGR